MSVEIYASRLSPDTGVRLALHKGYKNNKAIDKKVHDPYDRWPHGASPYEAHIAREQDDLIERLTRTLFLQMQTDHFPGEVW